MKIHYAAALLVILLASFIPLSVAEVTPSLLSVTDVSPSALSPGESATLKMTIENEGDFEAENVVVSWTDTTNTILPVGTGNTKTIGDIDMNGDEKVEFDITTDSSAAPGLYQLEITMKYTANGTLVTQEASVGIKIGGDTDFEVLLSDVDLGKVSLSILNVGRNPAESVTIELPKQEGYEPIGSAAMALDKIASDDYVVVPFSIKVKDATKDLKIKITYTDTDGVRKTISESIELEKYQLDTITGANLPEESSNTMRWVGILAVAVLIVFGRYFYKRRARKKHETD
tara:strand:+ start:140 stop:1000 length:861 start_codon:yes stop_codon:yes gene_type:complete